ncbi:mobile mystery protein A [Dongia sp.]|uniref:mobile mystery protein A n=1 Tax=Dongia sp. TaxID=1977262 RepID=UPI003750588F
MGVKQAATRQYQGIVDRVAGRLSSPATTLPREGWIATLRQALGMSRPQLAKRLGVTRARISQAEQAEVSGNVTLKTMHAFAEAMGCRFVYALVPVEGKVDDVIRKQALKKAGAIVASASTHMALERQALSRRENDSEVRRIAETLRHEMPSDLWEDDWLS